MYFCVLNVYVFLDTFRSSIVLALSLPAARDTSCCHAPHLFSPRSYSPCKCFIISSKYPPLSAVHSPGRVLPRVEARHRPRVCVPERGRLPGGTFVLDGSPLHQALDVLQGPQLPGLLSATGLPIQLLRTWVVYAICFVPCNCRNYTRKISSLDSRARWTFPYIRSSSPNPSDGILREFVPKLHTFKAKLIFPKKSVWESDINISEEISLRERH